MKSFTQREWFWTRGNESLYDLTKEEMVIWQQLISLLFGGK